MSKFIAQPWVLLRTVVACVQVPVSFQYSAWQFTRVWHIANYFVSIEFFVKTVPGLERPNVVEGCWISHPLQYLLIRNEVDVRQAQYVVDEFLEKKIWIIVFDASSC